MIHLLLYLFFISTNFSMFAMGNEKHVDHVLLKKVTIESILQEQIQRKRIKVPDGYLTQDSFIGSVIREIMLDTGKIDFDNFIQYTQFKNKIISVANSKAEIKKNVEKKITDLKVYKAEKENHDNQNIQLQLPHSNAIPITPPRLRRSFDTKDYDPKDTMEENKLKKGVAKSSSCSNSPVSIDYGKSPVSEDSEDDDLFKLDGLKENV